MAVNVTVRDVNGQPFPGVSVHVDNNSGGGTATTDAQGNASIAVGEPEFAGLELNGVRVVDRPWANTLGQPLVTQGLTVDVVVKAGLRARR